MDQQIPISPVPNIIPPPPKHPHTMRYVVFGFLVLTMSLIAVFAIRTIFLPSKSNVSLSKANQESVTPTDTPIPSPTITPTLTPTARPILMPSPTPSISPTSTQVFVTPIFNPTATVIPIPTSTPVPSSCAQNITEPTNLTPNNDVYDNSSVSPAGQLTLSWSSVVGATKYYLDIVDTTNNSNINLNVTNPIPTNSYVLNAQAGHTYRWSVQSMDDCHNISRMSFSSYIRASQ